MFVEDVQYGVGVMLVYWIYFKCCDLMNFEWDVESVLKLVIKYFDICQFVFLKGMIDCFKDKSKLVYLFGKYINVS